MIFHVGLTFELSRHRRRNAGPALQKMQYCTVAPARWLAVGARLERGVRPHPGLRREFVDKYNSVFTVGMMKPFRNESGCLRSKKGNGRSKK